MKKIFILFFILFTLNGFSSEAQKRTVYQKKVDQLTVKFLKKLGVRQSQIDRQLKMGELETFFTMGTVLLKLMSMEGLIAYEQYKYDVEKASKFKTKVDFQRERAEEKAEERRLALEEKIKNERKRQQELEEEAKEIEEERKRAEEETKRAEAERIEKYNMSDYGLTERDIQEGINEWSAKGEFEKQEDYNNRIKMLKQQAFDSICYKNVISRLKSYGFYDIDGYFRSADNVYLLQYNAETERFGLLFNFRNTEWTDSLNIPIGSAQNFKEKFKRIDISVSDTNWCFYENSLCPSRLLIMDKNTRTSYSFITNLKGIKEIEFKFIDKETQVKYDFNFTKYLNKLELDKKIKADSIKVNNLCASANQLLLLNNFDSAADSIKEAKAISSNAKLDQMLTSIYTKKRQYEALEKDRKHKNIVSLVEKYDTLLRVVFSNNEKLNDNGILNKYKHIKSAYYYYYDKEVGKVVILTDDEKTKLLDYHEKLDDDGKKISDNISNLNANIKTQNTLMNLPKDKLKEMNSLFKEFSGKPEYEYYYKIQEVFR